MLGNRGKVLFCLGFIWVLIGWSVPWVPPMPHRYWIIHEFLPMHLRMAAWMITGAAGIFFSPQRWPVGRDRWGFTALMLMPAERTVSYAVSWLVFEFSRGQYGLNHGWIGSAVWGALCAVIFICAGWPDPPPRLEP